MALTVRKTVNSGGDQADTTAIMIVGAAGWGGAQKFRILHIKPDHICGGMHQVLEIGYCAMVRFARESALASSDNGVQDLGKSL